MKIRIFIFLVIVFEISNVFAQTGKIVKLEIWENGNVAFLLDPQLTTCNGQLILNKSSPGFKTQYAAILLAKALDRPVRLYLGGCKPADEYGDSYNFIRYLYLD